MPVVAMKQLQYDSVLCLRTSTSRMVCEALSGSDDKSEVVLLYRLSQGFDQLY